MRLFAAVRDPREYRRGMVLGLTLAETLLLLMFLLLMALGALLWRRETELTTAQNQVEREVARSHAMERAAEDFKKRITKLEEDVRKLTAALSGLRPSDGRTLSPEELARTLIEGEEAKHEARELRTRLAEATSQIAGVAAERDRLGARLRELERQLGPEGTDQQGRVRDLERQRDELQAGLADERRRREQAENDLRNLSERIRRGGSLYPPCGPDEFSFRVTILDQGRAIVEDISTPAGRRHEAWESIRPFPRSTPISLSQFLSATRPYAEWGHSRTPECRFGVRVQDRTSASNKDGYKAAMGSLGSPPNFRPFWRVGG